MCTFTVNEAQTASRVLQYYNAALRNPTSGGAPCVLWRLQGPLGTSSSLLWAVLLVHIDHCLRPCPKALSLSTQDFYSDTQSAFLTWGWMATNIFPQKSLHYRCLFLFTFMKTAYSTFQNVLIFLHFTIMTVACLYQL